MPGNLCFRIMQSRLAVSNNPATTIARSNDMAQFDHSMLPQTLASEIQGDVVARQGTQIEQASAKEKREHHTDHMLTHWQTILVLDFGSQTSHLILRRLRGLNVYAEMLPCTTKLADLPFKPKGIILSGGPSSVYDAGSPRKLRG